MDALREKLDRLIYLASESPLSAEGERADELNAEVRALFPLFDPDKSHNDEKLNDYFLDVYGHRRSIGLQVSEAAQMEEISGTLMSMMLQGEGLSLERFVELAKREVSAIATFKRTNLEAIEDHIQGKHKDSWRAAIALLEKVLPAQYGQPLDLTGNDEESEVITEEMSGKESGNAFAEFINGVNEDADNQG